MTIYHMHHIIPKHAGGTDDPSNLIKLTIEEHAQAHLDLYEKNGDERDLLAYKFLLGQIDKQDLIKVLQKLPKTDQHKQKISESLKGERNPQWGKTTSQKQKDAVSKAMKGKKKNYKVECNWPTKSGKDNPASKAVICEGITYDTISEAGRAYGISKDSIRHRCLSDKPKWKDFSYYL